MLDKQNIDVQLASGIDTKSDDFSVISSKLAVLKNGKFVNKSSVATRPGFIPAITGGDLYNNPPVGMKRIHTRGTEVLVESNVGLHSTDTRLQKFITTSGELYGTPASLNRCSVEITGIDHPSQTVLAGDIAYDSANAMTCVVWTVLPFFAPGGTRQAGQQVWCRVEQSGIEIFRARLDTESLEGAFNPRVVSTAGSNQGNLFHIYWVANNNAAPAYTIKTCTFTCSTAALSSTTDLAVLLQHSAPTFDVAWMASESTGQGAVFLSYMDAAGTAVFHALKLRANDGFTVLKSATATPVTSPIFHVRNIAVVNPSAGRPGYVSILSAGSAGVIYVGVCDLDASSPGIVLTSLAVPGSDSKIAVMADTNAPGVFWVLWDNSGLPGTHKAALQCFTGIIKGSTTPALTTTGGIASVQSTLSVGVATDMWLLNDKVFAGVYHFSPTQTTFYAMQVGTSVLASLTLTGTASVVAPEAEVNVKIGMLSAFASVAMQEQNNGSGIRMPSKIAYRPNQFGDPMPAFCIQRGNEDLVSYGSLHTPAPYVAAGAFGFSPTGLDLLQLDYEAQLNSVTVEGGLVMAGASPQYFDGASLTELGFEYYPEPPILDGSSIAGTGSAGTYQVCIVYEWTDRNGQKFLSAPSTPASVTTLANKSISIVVPTLRLTRKHRVGIAIYATADSSNVFFRVQLGTNSIKNDPTVQTIAVGAIDTADLVPSLIGTGQLLYTTGGVLPALPFPACKHVALHQSRLFFAGCEQQERTFHTEEHQDGFFPSAHPAYSIDTELSSGRLCGLQSMDDKLVLFQESQISVVTGRGPNRLGLDNQYSEPVRVVTGYGHKWNESNTLAQDSAGIWFRDTAGLRHINRSLQISRVQVNKTTVVEAGAEVDNLIAGVIGNAARRDSTKQIYFANGSGGFLVWDYQFQQWSQYTRTAAVNVSEVACTTSDMFSLQGDGDFLWTERGSRATDANSNGGGANAIPLTWTSSWIRLQGLQSFQRLYKLMLLLQNVPAGSTHSITVEYDYLQNVTPVTVTADFVATGIGSSATPGAFDALTVGNVVQFPDGSRGTVSFIGLDDGGNPIFVTNGLYDSGGLSAVVSVYDGFGTPAATKTFSSDAAPRLQIENKVAKQKCESVRITYGHSSVNGGVRCAGMTLQLGTKKGTFKLPSSHRAT